MLIDITNTRFVLFVDDIENCEHIAVDLVHDAYISDLPSGKSQKNIVILKSASFDGGMSILRKIKKEHTGIEQIQEPKCVNYDRVRSLHEELTIAVGTIKELCHTGGFSLPSTLPRLEAALTPSIPGASPR